MKTKLAFALACVLALAACTNRPIVSEQQRLSVYGWDKNTPMEFVVDITDTVAPCDVLITLRNNESYPNQNLWLFIEQIAPDSTHSCDTVQCFLVDNQGHWIGSGIGDLHYIEVYYKQRARFAQRGTYRYNIRHGMRYDQLEGLNDIGIKIQRSKEE